MGAGEYRDASAAIERVRRLEEELEILKVENVALRERADSLLAGLDDNHLASELRNARTERDEIQRKLEEKSASNVAIVQRMLEERKDVERSFEVRIAALRAKRDPTLHAREEAFAREGALAVARKLAESVKERDELALALATGRKGEEDNLHAYLARVIDERDELLREVQRLRDSMPAGPRPVRETAAAVSVTADGVVRRLLRALGADRA